MTDHIAIIGTGPAGEAAGRELLRAGVRATLFDEQARTGGNVGRVRADSAATPLDHVASESERLTVMTGTRVTRVGDDATISYEHDGHSRSRRYTGVILACGAYDLHHPLKGLPDARTCTAGALQALLKGQGVVPTGRVVVAGTGPFLYVVAANLAAAGARVEAVVDRLRLSDYARLAAWSLLIPGNAREYAHHRTTLRHHGVRVLRGRGIIAITGDGLRLDDGTVLGYDRLGLTELFAPHGQLARTAGCRQRFSEAGGYWVTETDVWGRTSVARIYACGEGGGIRGWRHARLSGRLAARAALTDLGHGRIRSTDLHLRRRVQAGFGAALERALHRREPTVQPADTLCACEGTSVAAVDDAVALGLRDLSSIKIVTRCGMGPCQGRCCEPLVARRIVSAGVAPASPLNQHALTRPVPAGEYVRNV